MTGVLAVFMVNVLWGQRSTGTSLIAAAVVLGLPGLPGLIAGFVWLRGHWRDRVLWIDGEEVHGVVLVRTLPGDGTRLEVSYSWNGHEFGGRAWAPLGWEPWLVESPRGAPAVTDRVVLLVDPVRPGRFTLVPARCARVL